MAPLDYSVRLPAQLDQRVQVYSAPSLAPSGLLAACLARSQAGSGLRAVSLAPSLAPSELQAACLIPCWIARRRHRSAQPSDEHRRRYNRNPKPHYWQRGRTTQPRKRTARIDQFEPRYRLSAVGPTRRSR
jgi:hypothetical protein